MKNKKIQIVLVILLGLSVFLNLALVFVYSGTSVKVNNYLNKKDTLYLKDTIYKTNTDTLTETVTETVVKNLHSSYMLGAKQLSEKDMLDSANEWQNEKETFKYRYNNVFEAYKKAIDTINKISGQNNALNFLLKTIAKEYEITYNYKIIGDTTISIEYYSRKLDSALYFFNKERNSMIIDSVINVKKHKRKNKR